MAQLNLTDDTSAKVQKEGLILTRTIAPQAGLAQIHMAIVDGNSGMIGSLRVPVPE